MAVSNCYVVEVSAVDFSLNSEPWVDVSQAEKRFTDWILDVDSAGYHYRAAGSGGVP